MKIRIKRKTHRDILCTNYIFLFYVTWFTMMISMITTWNRHVQQHMTMLGRFHMTWDHIRSISQDMWPCLFHTTCDQLFGLFHTLTTTWLFQTYDLAKVKINTYIWHKIHIHWSFKVIKCIVFECYLWALVLHAILEL